MTDSRSAMLRYGAPAFGFACVAVVGMVFEAIIRAGLVNVFVIPLPSDVLQSIPRIVAEENLAHRFGQTSLELFWAAVLLTLVGVPLGVLLYASRLLQRSFVSWVGGLAAAPVVLAYPLFLVAFGRSAMTIVAIGFVAGLAPVILTTLDGLLGTRRVLLDVGKSFRLTPAQRLTKILLPSALPFVFVGLRLGLIFAMINIVGVEFLINFGGLGQLINELAERYDLPGTYAAILFVVLVSMLFFIVTARIERWLRGAT